MHEVHVIHIIALLPTVHSTYHFQAEALFSRHVSKPSFNDTVVTAHCNGKRTPVDCITEKYHLSQSLNPTTIFHNQKIQTEGEVIRQRVVQKFIVSAILVTEFEACHTIELCIGARCTLKESVS